MKRYISLVLLIFSIGISAKEIVQKTGQASVPSVCETCDHCAKTNPVCLATQQGDKTGGKDSVSRTGNPKAKKKVSKQ